MNEEMEPVQSMVEETFLLEKFFIGLKCNLTEVKRDVTVLWFQDNFNLKERAGIIGANVNGVKAHQHRGFNNIRCAMGRLDEEQE